MRLRRFRLALIACLLSVSCTGGVTAPATPATVVAAPRAEVVALPNRPDSLKFAVIGDNGTGGSDQYDIGKQMAATHEHFPFTLVVMLGDNIYGSERPQDFVRKFETPYKALLDAGVKFYASLGNHDSREQRNYKLYNMNGRLYYSFKAPKQNVRFFALESTYMDRDQIAWLTKELQGSSEDWKICFFHHPLYSSAGRHGSDTELRQVLEPLFVQYGVSLVLSGHDHVYERVKPQKGIAYFVEGSSGQLRRGDLRSGSPLTAKGFDTDRTFMVMEIDGDELNFQAISRTGDVVDSGVIKRRTNVPSSPH
jgi:predicted MPP superfamily phosphohydrolase